MGCPRCDSKCLREQPRAAEACGDDYTRRTLFSCCNVGWSPLRRQTVDDCWKHPCKLIKQSMSGHSCLTREFANHLVAKSFKELIRFD